MRFPVTVTCRRSAPVFLFVLSVHLAGMGAVSAAQMATDAPRIIVFALLLVSLTASLVSWRAARGQLRLAADGSCEYRIAEAEEFQPAECCWSTVWPGLAVAGFRLPGRSRSIGFVLHAGTLPAEELRRVRVWLLNCRAPAC